MDHNYANNEAYCCHENERFINKTIKKTFMGNGNAQRSTTKKDIVEWELSNGKKIDIDSMSVEHLRNVLKFIVKNNLLKPKL